MATATTERPAPRFTTLDEVLDYVPCSLGIPLERLGGAVGSFIIFGHHEPRYIIAAVNAYCREDGFLPAGGGYVENASAITYKWVRFVEACDWLDRPDHTDACGLCARLAAGHDWLISPAAPGDPRAVAVSYWRRPGVDWNRNWRGQWVRWGDELDIPEAAPDAPTGPYPPDRDLHLAAVTRAAAAELGYSEEMCEDWVTELAQKHARGWDTERIVASLRCRFVDDAPAAQPEIVEFVTSRLDAPAEHGTDGGEAAA